MALVQALGGDIVLPPKKKQKRNKAIIESSRGSVAFDQLSWREVPFPENFEDAEGFFGLEEVSDVEVTQDGGKIGYNLAATKSKKSKPAAKESSFEPTQKGQDVVENEDEWSGFEDDQPDGVNQTSLRSQQKSPKVSNKKQTIKNGSGSLANGGYEALQGLEEDSANVSAWDELGLSDEILTSLAKLNFAKPTAIQKAAIPEIIEGHDVIGKAPTGSGKTLAYGIPILERFLSTRTGAVPVFSESNHSSTALIISPTRELAHQLSTHLGDLSASTDGFPIATVTGGLSVHKQQRLLASADIIIGTPGRLWELMSEDSGLRGRLRRVQFLVLDEADRLFSEGHFKELSEIIHALDLEDEDREKSGKSSSQVARQTLVFSATFQKDLQRKLKGKGKFFDNELLDEKGSMSYLLKKLRFREEKPKFIDVNPDRQMAQNLTERMLECPALEKDLHLYAVLLHQMKQRTLVFVNSIAAVRRLVPFLQNLKIPALALHSEMPQKARLRSIERFSSPSPPTSVLVATDVAARGLDIPEVHLILHYHVPHSADMYIHRSGRTARAEETGASILLCSPEEIQGVRRLIAKVHVRATSQKKDQSLSTMELDPKITTRIKPRVTLSKKITDATLAKEKHSQEYNWLRNAAEELGVDYDSDEFANQKGRGGGRKKREKEARSLTKEEINSLKYQLKEELEKRVNVGVSERYITSGGLDVDSLLEEKEQGSFLGKREILDLEV